MNIRCWGSRGSIPVNGKQFLKYGGDTTCIEIVTNSGDLIIIDAGSGIRLLGESLIKHKKQNITILLTHAHWDHLLGFPFFVPLYSTGYNITIRGLKYGKPSTRSIFMDLLARPYHPVQLTDKDVKSNLNFKKLTPEKTFTVGSCKITSIPLSHPKDGGLGFKFEDGGSTFVFITDNELGHVHKGGKTFEEYVAFCKDADLLIHDAQYTQEEYNRIMKISEVPWGHSSCNDTVKLGIAANVKELGLFHIDPSHSDNFVDDMVKSARNDILKRTKKPKVFYVSSGFTKSL